MKDISFNEQREILLDVLDLFANRCEQKGLRYTLAWGSLLGAVRHKGMIPWDDDIDVAMPRPDYERFIESITEEPLSDKIHWIDHKHPVKAYYPFMFGKLGRKDTVIKYPDLGDEYEIELAIDVFPFDGAPSVEEYLKIADESYDITLLINRCVCMPGPGRGPIRMRAALARRRLRQIFVYKSWIGRRFDIITKYDFDKCPVCGSLSNGNYKGIHYNIPSDFFNNTVMMPFEGREYRCLKDYDISLERVFENYMELPPEEERVDHHNYSSVKWR